MASTAAPIRFAEGEDTEQVTAGLNSLRQRGWQLDNEGIGITKTFYFKTYFKAVVCMPNPPGYMMRPHGTRTESLCYDMNRHLST